MGWIHRGRGSEGGSRPIAARLQARPSFPLVCLQQPGDGFRHVRGGGYVQVYMLAVLLEHSAHVPVLAKNVNLDHREYHPYHNGVQFFPVPNVQGGQMCFIAHPHTHGTSGSFISRANTTPTRASALSSVSATSTAAAAVASTSTASAATVTTAAASTAAAAATASTSSTHQLRQSSRKEQPHMHPTLQLEEDGFYIKWHRLSRCPYFLQVRYNPASV